MEEIWKDIKGFEGLYQVSNLGNIKSLDRYMCRSHNEGLTIKGKIRIPQLVKGYYQIVLCKDGINFQYKVHRLVAEAFILNPNNYPCINHKDENPVNNKVENLEWCTHKYNNNYGHHKEKCSKSMKGKLAGDKNPMYGNHSRRGAIHSEKSKQKIRETHIGRIWINNDIINKLVKSEELETYLSQGFHKGRK